MPVGSGGAIERVPGVEYRVEGILQSPRELKVRHLGWICAARICMEDSCQKTYDDIDS
jgi:hypothetical protein